MDGQLGLLELSVISWVSTVDGFPLYNIILCESFNFKKVFKILLVLFFIIFFSMGKDDFIITAEGSVQTKGEEAK